MLPWRIVSAMKQNDLRNYACNPNNYVRVTMKQHPVFVEPCTGCYSVTSANSSLLTCNYITNIPPFAVKVNHLSSYRTFLHPNALSHVCRKPDGTAIDKSFFFYVPACTEPTFKPTLLEWVDTSTPYWVLFVPNRYQKGLISQESLFNAITIGVYVCKDVYGTPDVSTASLFALSQFLALFNLTSVRSHIKDLYGSGVAEVEPEKLAVDAFKAQQKGTRTDVGEAYGAKMKSVESVMALVKKHIFESRQGVNSRFLAYALAKLIGFSYSSFSYADTRVFFDYLVFDFDSALTISFVDTCYPYQIRNRRTASKERVLQKVVTRDPDEIYSWFLFFADKKSADFFAYNTTRRACVREVCSGRYSNTIRQFLSFRNDIIADCFSPFMYDNKVEFDLASMLDLHVSSDNAKLAYIAKYLAHNPSLIIERFTRNRYHYRATTVKFSSVDLLSPCGLRIGFSIYEETPGDTEKTPAIRQYELVMPNIALPFAEIREGTTAVAPADNILHSIEEYNRLNTEGSPAVRRLDAWHSYLITCTPLHFLNNSFLGAQLYYLMKGFTFRGDNKKSYADFNPVVYPDFYNLLRS